MCPCQLLSRRLSRRATHPFECGQGTTHARDEGIEPLQLLQQHHCGGRDFQTILLADLVQLKLHWQLVQHICGNLHTSCHQYNHCMYKHMEKIEMKKGEKRQKEDKGKAKTDY